MSKGHRFARKIAALVLGLVLAVLGAELFYRWTRLGRLSPTTNPAYVRHDAELGWSYEPNALARHESDEFAVDVRIDARGFRGPEWPAQKRGKRVLVLGDSFAFGWGVPYEQSFCARLQEAHPDWQVLNAAVSGYSVDQELLLARRLVPELAPDVVVCTFCSNDLWEARSGVAYGKHKPRFIDRGGQLELVGVPVPQPWLERSSALWRALLKRRWESALADEPRDRAEEWRLVCDILRAMRDLLHGVPLVIASEEPRLAGLAREERGMLHADLRSALAHGEQPVIFARDGHWTGHGHACVARAIDAVLVALP